MSGSSPPPPPASPSQRPRTPPWDAAPWPAQQRAEAGRERLREATRVDDERRARLISSWLSELANR